MGLIQDSEQELLDLFAQVHADQPDVLITTGGMGPGKYDLVEKTFAVAGGQVLFSALAMRPGQSVLFGLLGRTLLFGLPGPPHAARTLLHELVGPALLAMQGKKDPWPKKIAAHVLHQIKVKPHKVLRLKDAVLLLQDGRCFVRFAGRLETPNCLIVLEPGVTGYSEGALVQVHLPYEFSLSHL
jgi:molybdopterin molybdotransferase